VAFYMRTARFDTATTSSIAAQRGILQAEAARRPEWAPIGEYIEDYTGRTDTWPALRTLMAAVRAREVDVVAVTAANRIARNARHLSGVLLTLHAHGAHLVSVADDFDTSTPIGGFAFRMAEVLADVDASLTRERTLVGLAAARQRGIRLGRAPVPIDAAAVAISVEREGSIRAAAAALGISPGMVQRRLQEHRQRKEPV
jgi:DNA invertase Pin-like site-specific DNA recombinase